MAYSTIVQRKDYCIDCNDGVLKDCIAKRCKSWHYWRHRNEVSLNKRNGKTTFPSMKLEKEMIKPELEKWFDEMMATSEKKCENCGADLSGYNKKDWRSSQHHILEKRFFKSVEANPLNHGVLGMWCCHSQWHTNYENAAKMPFFKIAKERFELFKNDIALEERKKIPNCFL